MESQSKYCHLPNLNGIRFIAALMVFVAHVEWMKKISGLPNYASTVVIQNNGVLGVSLFFVLSGFLITFLLLVEKRKTGTIMAKAFYLRRILRIWPLYFVTVVLAFFFFPWLIGLPGWEFAIGKATYGTSLLMFAMMLPNISYVMLPLVPFASQLWTVGVEEQCYLLWPLICRRLGSRGPGFLFGVVLLMTLGRGLLLSWSGGREPSQLREFLTFLDGFRIQCMAIGGIAAWLACSLRWQRITEFLFRRNVELTALSIAIFINVVGIPSIGMFQSDICAVCYGVLILNAAMNAKTICRLEWRPLPYLGRISYGLYIWQIIAIRISVLLLQHGNLLVEAPHRMFSLYVLSAILTVVLAALSYRFLELPFLKQKLRFSPVPSFS
jgi:peptidoglycan/LPS O-acetylase OafA/YrhL